jgi:hypothetical protein
MNETIKEKAKKEFDIFFNIAWHARHMFRLYCKLYEESEDRIELLNKSASEFFADLQTMWHEHILLDVCKLTDSCENGVLTISYFTCRYENQFSEEEEAIVKEIMNSVERFRLRIKKARNKVIAHISKKEAMNNEPLGGLSDEEMREGKQMYQMIDKFYDNLQKIINIISSKIYGSAPEEYLMPLDPTGNAAEELISLLTKAYKKSATSKEG